MSTVTTDQVLAVEALAAGYGQVNVLSDVTFAMRERSIVAVVGKNGAGKSTLFKALVGTIEPTSGGIELVGHRGQARHRALGSAVTYCPQDFALFSDFTVRENLRLGCLRVPPRQRAGRMEAAFDMFPVLGRRLEQKAGTLSGGEQKMLNLARAVLPKPRLLVIDEISEGLQPAVLAQLQARLIELNRSEQVSIIVAEQNLAMIEALATDYVLLHAGRVIETGAMNGPQSRRILEKHLEI